MVRQRLVDQWLQMQGCHTDMDDDIMYTDSEGKQKIIGHLNGYEITNNSDGSTDLHVDITAHHKIEFLNIKCVISRNGVEVE